MRAIPSGELREGMVTAVEVDGWPVAVARADGAVHAVVNRCTHAAAAFAPGGRVRRGVLMCPAHGARFELEGGRCVGGLHRPLRIFAVREEDGWIAVAVPADPPGPDEQPVTR